ncbi:MAG: InlB B-repeat-containing protein [Clostridia bacterium]|nr:InlB B-repeat-containing protein [Clostridia bacterium]
MKKMKKILAFALVLAMVFSALSVFALVGAAEEPITSTDLGMSYTDYQPIPMLIIKINFEVDGIEGDCYEVRGEDGVERILAYNKKLKDKPQYGEQYCYSPDSYWAEMCFGDERGTLNDYYKYISNGKFYWIPVEETSGTANDGVITVTVNAKHPGTQDSSGLYDANERRLAVEAADQYVDFSKYDKDGNGDLDFTELSITFIYGGNEISYNTSESVQYTYNTHAHVSSVVFGGLTCDGVGVWSKGAQRYVRMGERGGSDWSKMGKLAHELGHVLGAKDLYIDSESWIGGCGQLSLMGGGSGGYNTGFSSPTVLDPYYKVIYGFAKEEVASSETKEYTLYSHESTEGAFNVIRVNTPNPREYYLIENRSHSSDGYDNNGLNGDMQGILIWHIDQGIVNGYARPNNGDEGHAAGFTIISPTDAHFDVDENSTWSSTSASNVFIASNEAQYKFPVSTPDGTAKWYTSMSEAQAAQCNIKIEFLTEAGNEMKIRISGAHDLPAEFTTGEGERTQTSMVVAANITDFNGADVTSCKIYFGTNKELTDAQVVEATRTSATKFSAKFEGLKASTEYYFKVEMTTAYGTSSSAVSSAFTNAAPVEKTRATVTLVINSDIYNTTTTKVSIGSELKINFPMTKKGYTFAGWYLDEACTQEYTIAPLETADDFTLYAKWVSSAPAGTTAGTNAPVETPDDGTTAPQAAAPSGGCGGGSAAAGKNDMLMLCGGSVAAVFCAAAGKKLGKKKDGSDETEE